MKYFYLLILLSLLGGACQKKLLKSGYVGYGYRLENGVSFQYDRITCTRWEQGRGRYKISEDTITFEFKPFVLGHKYSIKKIAPLISGIDIDLKVIDVDTKDSIAFYNMNVYCANGFFQGNAQSYFSGQLHYHIRDTSLLFPVKIEIKTLSHYPAAILLTEPGKYKILAEIKTGTPYLRLKGTRSFWIKTWTKDTMILDELWNKPTYLPNG